MKRIGTLLTSIILLLWSYQNCTRRVSFVASNPTKASNPLRANSNGEGYGGKPDPGEFYRTYPGYTCPLSASPKSLQSQITVSAISLQLSFDTCTSLQYPIAPNALDYESYNPDYFGYLDGIFARSGLNQSLPALFTETWCRSNTGLQGFDTVLRVPEDLTNAQTEIYIGKRDSLSAPWLKSKVAPFPVSRVDSVDSLSYSASDFSLQVERAGFSGGLHNGNLQATVDGQTYQLNVQCRLMTPAPSVTPLSELTPLWMNLSGLIAYWQFDLAAAMNGTLIPDVSGSGNDATLDLTPAGTDKIAPGKIAQSVAFNGTSDSFSNMSPIGFPAANSPQSVSGWFKFANYAAIAQGGILTMENRAATSAVFVGFNNGTQALKVAKWGGGDLVRSPDMTLPPNVWNHYVYTFDGTTHRLYFNGGEVANATTVPDSGQPNEIRGAYMEGTPTYFGGELDEISVWTRALSPAEVLSIYSRQSIQ